MREVELTDLGCLSLGEGWEEGLVLVPFVTGPGVVGLERVFELVCLKSVGKSNY
jgi:hypothetical protein